MNDPSARFDVKPAPRGTRFTEIRTFDVLDSTNRYLVDLAQDGEPEGVVAIARHQSEGRGRQGRKWDSKPGTALLLSVLLTPRDIASAQRVGHALGLAVVDACKFTAGIDAHLKWPNDVIVNERKLAGVLAELVTDGDDVLGVVAGAGVNLNWAGEMPEALRSIAISADEIAGERIDAEAFTEALLRALHERLARPTWLMQAYRERCITIGRDVLVTTMRDETFDAKALDVDDDGALIVERASGEQLTVRAGDVLHVRAV